MEKGKTFMWAESIGILTHNQRVILQCGQFTVNLRKIVRFYPNYIL